MSKKILMSGNEAIGEGAIHAGCRFYAGYPITPQNELTAYMAKRMAQEDRVFIQAESELAAINMVLGASAAGARAMTSSSSPGMSLKQEGISYLSGCQLPCVIVNIMRAGPGLGNISPSQSDYFQATRGGGHGDYYSIVLAPASVQEALDLMLLSFELADRYRNPVLLLGDGMLGQMMEPVTRINADRKISENPRLWVLDGCKNRKPNVVKSLFLGEGELERANKDLQKKYQKIRTEQQRWEGLFLDDARVVLVAYGTLARVACSAVKQLRRKGKRVGLIRPISLWPFPAKAFIPNASKRTRYIVFEMSHGQMLEDVRLTVEGKAPVEFFGRAGGGIPSEEQMIKKIVKLLKC